MTSPQKETTICIVSELYEIVYSGTPVKTVVAESFMKAAKKAAYWYNKKKKAKRASVDVLRKVLAVPHLHVDSSGSYFYPISKKDGDVKFVRLKSKLLSQSIDEVKERKIHRRDNSRGATKKLTEIKKCYEALEKLTDVLEGFTWRGFESLKLRNSTIPNDLQLEGKILLFNSTWIKTTPEREIANKLRSFVSPLS